MEEERFNEKLIEKYNKAHSEAFGKSSLIEFAEALKKNI